MIDKITLPEDNYNVPDYDEKLANKTNEIVDEVNDLNTLMAQIKLEMNPVGTIYESTNSTNPSTFIGGTWEEYGKGRVTVGLDGSSDFNTIGKTGGEKTHTLTIDEIPPHNHKINFSKGAGVYGNPAPGSGGSDWVNSTNTISNTGGGEEHNNLQPYIVVYRWRRTA